MTDISKKMLEEKAVDIKNAEYTVEKTVVAEYLAKNVGSGDVSVFATPMMIAMMEEAAAAAVKPFLKEGQTTVGAFIGTSHTAPTPLGMIVWATAKVTSVDGKKIEFSVSAKDEATSIGEGVHTRYIIEKERFEQKAQSKL